MLIKFTKLGTRWRAHLAHRVEPKFSFHFYFYPDDRIKIAKHLKDLGFDSCSYEESDVSLTFDDPADEAVFMLWVAGGIEI